MFEFGRFFLCTHDELLQGFAVHGPFEDEYQPYTDKTFDVFVMNETTSSTVEGLEVIRASLQTILDSARESTPAPCNEQMRVTKTSLRVLAKWRNCEIAAEAEEMEYWP
jgi:hypothetical protein